MGGGLGGVGAVAEPDAEGVEEADPRVHHRQLPVPHHLSRKGSCRLDDLGEGEGQRVPVARVEPWLTPAPQHCLVAVPFRLEPPPVPLGQSTGAGIDVDGGDTEALFLAATLFGTPTSAAIAQRTFAVLDGVGVVRQPRPERGDKAGSGSRALSRRELRVCQVCSAAVTSLCLPPRR